VLGRGGQSDDTDDWDDDDWDEEDWDDDDEA
jgi:hypothetical protein